MTDLYIHFFLSPNHSPLPPVPLLQVEVSFINNSLPLFSQCSLALSHDIISLLHSSCPYYKSISNIIISTFEEHEKEMKGLETNGLCGVLIHQVRMKRAKQI